MQEQYPFQTEPISDAAATGILIAFALVALAIKFGVLALICYFMANNFKAIPDAHRRMPPGQVWLMMIPFFNLYWIFRVFLDLADSFKSYFNSIGRMDVGDCGRQLGLWFCVCMIAALPLGLVPCLNVILAPMVWIASLVLLILYLVKASDLKRKIGAPAVPPPPLRLPREPGNPA
jgi:hypothetical protein